jgi:hypothetical protein
MVVGFTASGLSKVYVDIKFDMFNMKFKYHLFYLPLAIGQVDNLVSPPLAVNPTTIRSLLSTICLAEKYKDKLYNVLFVMLIWQYTCVYQEANCID